MVGEPNPQVAGGPGPSPVTTLIGDADALARLGLRTLLRPIPEISVVADTDDAAALPDLVAVLRPDVVVVDDRFGATPLARRGVREVARVPSLLVMATATGADGSGPPDPVVVPKSAAAAQIIGTIAAVAGRPPLRRARPGGLDALTPREAEVLGLVAHGFTNAEICALLDLSLETVRTHLKHIYGKCGASDRTQAAVAAYRGGLVTPS